MPDADYVVQVGSRAKDVPWYNPTLGTLKAPTKELFEKYCNIPSDQVVAHITKVREEAWEVWPYPCIGGWRFLDLYLAEVPAYSEVLDRLKNKNQIYLDLGCCFGQDIRKLVYDGAPQEHIYGAELRPGFVESGYKLFNDKDKLKSKILTPVDIFDEESLLKDLEGKVDIIYAGAFLHLFGWDGQMKVATRIAQILKPVKGSMLLGRQVGSVEPGEHQHSTNSVATMYRHDVDSFKKLWNEVGEATDSKWEVIAELENTWGRGEMPEDQLNRNWQPETTRRLTFQVVRL